MNVRLVSLALVVVAASALADDGTKPAAKAPPKDAAAPKERKTSPEAEAAFAKYGSLLHFPNAKYKSITVSARTDIEVLGGEVSVKVTSTPDKPVSCKVELPEATKQAYPPEQLEPMQEQVAQRMSQLFEPFLLPPTVTAKQYDMTARTKDGKTVVDLVRFDPKAAWDKATLYFSAEGLLEKQVGTLNVDPNDQMAAMYAGVELELTTTYTKVGDLYVISGASRKEPVGDTTLKIACYEIAGAPPLPKEITVNTPMLPEPLVISVYDWVLDGKAVAGTERKEVKKPDPTPPKKDDKPATPPTPK